MITDIKNKTGLVQWKNSYEVIGWFNNTENKKAKCFVCFDIVEYYPSIWQEQLKNAIEFARNYTDISDSDVEIIWHACDTVLNFDKRVWKKKSVVGLFDVPMGSFHGAEICDLVGLYILQGRRIVYYWLETKWWARKVAQESYIGYEKSWVRNYHRYWTNKDRFSWRHPWLIQRHI